MAKEEPMSLVFTSDLESSVIPSTLWTDLVPFIPISLGSWQQSRAMPGFHTLSSEGFERNLKHRILISISCLWYPKACFCWTLTIYFCWTPSLLKLQDMRRQTVVHSLCLHQKSLCFWPIQYDQIWDKNVYFYTLPLLVYQNQQTTLLK